MHKLDESYKFYRRLKIFISTENQCTNAPMYRNFCGRTATPSNSLSHVYHFYVFVYLKPNLIPLKSGKSYTHIRKVHVVSSFFLHKC